MLNEDTKNPQHGSRDNQAGDSPVCRRYASLPAHPDRIAEGGKRLSSPMPVKDTSTPRVSVITVVYDGAETLESCIRSVIDQTHENVEHIIIDGGSRDGTLDIIRRYEKDIDYFVSEPDNGIYDAMNKGLAVAFGDYVLILNSDDWYREDAIQQLVKAAGRGGADVVHADAVKIDARGKNVGTIEGPLHAGLYTSSSLVRHETMLVRREVYDRFGGYDTTYSIIADHVYTISLYDADCKFEYLPQKLLYFRITGKSNEDLPTRRAERARMFRTSFPFIEDVDIDRLSLGKLRVKEMLGLVEKYQGQSEIFSRSLACSIGNSPSVKFASKVIEPVAGRVARTAARSILSPMKRWLIRNDPYR